ncbi:AKH-like peptide [Tribolium castaneum]|uniref:AKH-I preprohormone n=1 Tax=Tribolium castaneum TaxID=7070 RepID=B8K1Y2_TRICA|nr:AKH-I preprohormone [Tribolium castaneum]EFA11613.2 AKH-like peptide [Tribolium castaneum]
MSRMFLIVVLIAFVGVCTAQLNFSTDWGKRSGSSAGSDANNCKEPVETIMLIYKIIQNEAQKIIECEKYA